MPATIDEQSWIDPLNEPPKLVPIATPKTTRKISKMPVEGIVISTALGIALAVVIFIAATSDIPAFLVFAGAIMGICAVFLPTIIASCRNHRNMLAIILLNMFALGGAVFAPVGLLWIAALIWSVYVSRDE